MRWLDDNCAAAYSQRLFRCVRCPVNSAESWSWFCLKHPPSENNELCVGQRLATLTSLSGILDRVHVILESARVADDDTIKFWVARYNNELGNGNGNLSNTLSIMCGVYASRIESVKRDVKSYAIALGDLLGNEPPMHIAKITAIRKVNPTSMSPIGVPVVVDRHVNAESREDASDSKRQSNHVRLLRWLDWVRKGLISEVNDILANDTEKFAGLSRFEAKWSELIAHVQEQMNTESGTVSYKKYLKDVSDQSLILDVSDCAGNKHAKQSAKSKIADWMKEIFFV